MKICILQPLYRLMPTETYNSMINLTGYFAINKINYAIITTEINPVDMARNVLTEKFIQAHKLHNFDYVLWIDSDQVFDPDQIGFLINSIARNKFDILTARYNVRTTINVLCAYRKNNKLYDSIIPLDNGYEEIDSCGFGCIIMKPDVLISLQKKHSNELFKFSMIENDQKRKGEDFCFCEHAKKAGYKIMLDNNVHIGHWGFII